MARKKTHHNVPTHDKFLIPTIEALKLLGGSGSIEEINEKVYEIAQLDQETLDVPHGENGVQSKVDYGLAWARTYLKKFGLIENSSRGVWSLINNDINPATIDPAKILKTVRRETSGYFVQTMPGISVK